ncbi:cob(I)alamin adenosyltransferase [Bacteroides reticulotermitis JCM 10512]|uniref:corrinoid adenosyltransferase n=1 Tax=Bacteroides reticulotermitis JCM 10512 TaxID=1445607 RepID=W4UWM8_9BACE|nr:cob(I)alamin adenosyltransferase [Bacteroides reticulotermitis JCM 10512]
MEKGYIHVYTGDGKGKTTAAFGLAVRAFVPGSTSSSGNLSRVCSTTKPVWLRNSSIYVLNSSATAVC